jgi:hypothetical protein
MLQVGDQTLRTVWSNIEYIECGKWAHLVRPCVTGNSRYPVTQLTQSHTSTRLSSTRFSSTRLSTLHSQNMKIQDSRQVYIYLILISDRTEAPIVDDLTELVAEWASKNMRQIWSW